MSAELDAISQGVEGAGGPSQAGVEDRGVSRVSDSPTACHAADDTRTPVDASAADDVAKPRRRGSPRLDTRYDEATLKAIRTRAKRLGLTPSAWVRATVRDALDARRTDELDAAVAASLLGVEGRVQASADARELGAQIRPLAINVNDLDHRARSGEPITLCDDVPELIELLREVRQLLGDRMSA